MVQFCNKKGAGVVLFVYSCIFSRTIAKVQTDMDTASGLTPTLVGAHNYCSQEMVNLLLTGRATSNVFDGQKVLGDDDADAVTLHGVSKRTTVGFLTLFEAYDYMTVGGNLKTPLYPIWVICSESHYSILFCEDATLVATEQGLEQFDLHYYDGLAHQDEPIRLSINSSSGTPMEKPIPRDALIPPLNLVIQTKWPRAAIDWNATEPIL